MPEPVAEKNSTQAPARETMPAQPVSEQKQSVRGGEHGGIYAIFREIAAASAGQEPPPGKFSPFFRKAEFANPINDAQKARVLGALQERYGNRYVQRVLSPGAESQPLADTTPAMRIFRHEESGASSAPPLSGSSVPSSIESSSGHSLSGETQQFMESRFGHDFDNVRVHDDAHAHEAAKNLSAEAFTTGRDIYFSPGAYNPSTSTGQQLLAHELTHVVQQDRGAAIPNTYGFHVSQPGDELERQADDASDAVMRGEMFPPITSSPSAPTIARQASGGGAGGGGTTAPAATGGGGGAAAPTARAGDFPITIAGTTVTLPTAALIDRAMPGGRLPVPSKYFKVLSVPGFKVTGASLDFDENKAPKGATIDAAVDLKPLDGTGSLTVDKSGNASGTAHINFHSQKIPGIKETTVDAAISKDNFNIDATLEYDLPHVTGTLSYKYQDKKHSGKGTAKYEGAKLKGDIEIILSEAGKISGSGKLDMELFKGLRGEIDVAVDEKRDIQVKGKLSVPGQVELFPEKKIEKSFFSFEKKFPLWGIVVPVVDINVGLFAEIHAGAGFRAKFGPGVLRDIALTGEFGTDPEAATEFGLGGEFFVPAGAEVVINAGGGIGLGLAIADITGGVEAVGVAGLYTALSVRPQFQYAGGKYTISGVAELAGVAQAKFGINAFAKIDVGVWMFKGTVWRKDWKLAEWVWNSGLNVSLKANISYTLGDDFAPDISFETGQVDPEKLIRDVMPESGSPVPAPPKPPVPDKGGFNAQGAQGQQAPGAALAAGPTPPTPGSPPATTQPGQAPPTQAGGPPGRPGGTPPPRPGDQPQAAQQPGQLPPADPAAKSAQVKSKVSQELAGRFQKSITTFEELDSILSTTFQKYKPEGLHALTVKGDKDKPGEYDVLAEASLPASVAHFLKKIVGLRAFRLKLDMFSEKTFLFVDMPDGSVTTEQNMGGDRHIGGIHAEQFFLGRLPEYRRRFRGPENDKSIHLRFVLRLNRAPCPACIADLSAARVDARNENIEIVVMPTAPYARSAGEGQFSIPITTVKHLADLVEAGIQVEVWDIWAIIKQEQSDPMLQNISDDLINRNLEGKAQLESQLRGVKAELESRRKVREANKR